MQIDPSYSIEIPHGFQTVCQKDGSGGQIRRAAPQPSAGFKGEGPRKRPVRKTLLNVALEPIVHKEVYGDLIEPEIQSYFDEAIFGPLFAILAEAGVPTEAKFQAIKYDEFERTNASTSAIEEGIREGRIWYAAGAFGGSFNAGISRELRNLGAVRDPHHTVFLLQSSDIPILLRGFITASAYRADAIHRGMISLLTAMESNVAKAPTGLNISAGVDRILVDLNHQFVRTIEDPVKGLEGITVSPQIQPSVRKRITEDLTENLDLYIKDFASEKIPELRRMVEDNLQKGGRIDKLAKGIEAQYGVSKRKAKFLASQETSLLTAKFRQERSQEAGSSKYVWMTRHDNKVRHDHAELNGKTFFWDDPPVVDQLRGRRANPGEDYNCLPGDSRIDILRGVKKAFRRWYGGELTTLVLESGKTLRATPNHPVLTLQGWKPIGSINQGDDLLDISEQCAPSVEANKDQGVSMIREIFETLRKTGLSETLQGESRQFHGDGSDNHVDIINSAGFLRFYWKTLLLKGRSVFAFSVSNKFRFSLGGPLKHLLSFVGRYPFRSSVCRRGQSLSLSKRGLGHANEISLGLRSNGDIVFSKTPTDGPSIQSGSFRDGEFAFPGNVGRNYRSWNWLNLIPRLTRNRNADSGRSKVARDAIRTKSNKLLHFIESHSFGQKTLRVIEVRREKFFGHVYNFETDSGWYCSDGLIIKNCRCSARPIIELPKSSAAA